MSDKEEVKLTPEEEKAWRDGMAIYEMTKSRGFEVMKEWLEDRAFHSWADPRETNSQDEWVWRELNSFHAATTAREQLEWLQQLISQSDYLDKVKKGEISRNRMRI